MRALVTGASGFIGRLVCAELAERGHEVSALVRRPGTHPKRTQPVTGDLTEPGSIARAVTDARPEVVLHLAAEIASQRDARKIDLVNVEGMRNLLDACRASGNPRVVFVSTVVTGDARGATLYETTDLPVETAYGRSKQKGEAMLRESGLPWVILRPGHVYGAGGWFAEEIVGRLRSFGRLAVVGSGENLWDVVRGEDVARACVDAAERAPDGSLYHVADDEPITYGKFVELTAQALGVGAPRHVPPWLARRIAGADTVRAVTRSARTSNSHLKAEVGWKPLFPTAAVGIPDAVAKLSG